MKFSPKQVYGPVVFLLALGTAGASAGWFWSRRTVVRSLQREPVRAVVAGAAYLTAEVRSPQVPLPAWRMPPAQSRGRDWLYEVFTPPAITYHPVTGSFLVTPPHSRPVPVAQENGLELLAVKRESFRLQLLGYFGAAGDCVGVFTSSLVPETLLARPGDRLGSLRLILKSIEVRKVAAGDEPEPAPEIAALAVLEDEITGVEVVLDSRARKFTDTLLAVFKTARDRGRTLELHEGDTFLRDDEPWRIERIELDPPGVIVARMTAGTPAAGTEIMRPPGSVAGREAPSRSPVVPASADVARNEPPLLSP